MPEYTKNMLSKCSWICKGWNITVKKIVSLDQIWIKYAYSRPQLRSTLSEVLILLNCEEWLIIIFMWITMFFNLSLIAWLYDNLYIVQQYKAYNMFHKYISFKNQYISWNSLEELHFVGAFSMIKLKPLFEILSNSLLAQAKVQSASIQTKWLKFRTIIPKYSKYI